MASILSIEQVGKMTRTDTRDYLLSTITENLAYDDIGTGITITEDAEIIYTDLDSGKVRKITVIVE